jgi:hypothetical protein
MSTKGVSHRSINLKTVMVVPKGASVSVKLTGFDLATGNFNDCIPEQYIFNVMPLWYLRRCMGLEPSSPAERVDSVSSIELLMVKIYLLFIYRQGKFRGWFFRRRRLRTSNPKPPPKGGLCHIPGGKSRLTIMPATKLSCVVSGWLVESCVKNKVRLYTCYIPIVQINLACLSGGCSDDKKFYHTKGCPP